MDALVGRTLGEFVLRERIGQGGFGAVYRAIQPGLDREAVVKVLHTGLATSAAAQERFLREAKLASKLDHPYAAHVYAFGTSPDGDLWIAMELVRGTPLDQVLQLQGPLPLERFVPLLHRICEVVHTAHEAGIIHRDLKPANVMMLARAGRLLPKLLDFGIAKGLAPDVVVADTVEAQSSPTATTVNLPVANGLTVRGAVMGSPPYMAPEQWLDAGQVDARTDLYALGILTYECLTGQPPYTGATLTAIAEAHARNSPPPLGKGFPAALDKVLAKALAKDAADRYPDALALAAAVRAASEIAVEVARPPSLEPALREAAVTGMPQPIAEAIAALDASKNNHQARDALVLVGRTVARYLGLLALSCRSRVHADDSAAELIRTLYRRALTDREWLELARRAIEPWIARREAYPVPELVEALHDSTLAKHLDALVSIRDAATPTDDAMHALLEAGVAAVAQVLDGIAFLRDYVLVVTASSMYAERWMGVRRPRVTAAVKGKGLETGVAALLDRDGVPVLTLSPLFAIAAPAPGSPLELFLFEGRDSRGAKLVSLPSGFEHHDDELWDWFRMQLVGSLDDTEAAVVDEKPPYRGLSAFSVDDASTYVGREKQVDAFANRLKLLPLLVVVGPSGAGKSSFVHAGVVPALGWRTIIVRPGPSPLAALAARLAPTTSSLRDALEADRDALGRMLRADAAERGPLLLIVDQFEELFTLCQDDAERSLFAEALAVAARSVDDPVRVVFTLRDDFLVRAEQVASLRNRISQGLQILTVPAFDDLMRIVSEPARRVGYELEVGLAEEMVQGVAEQPGALALISFTASKLWDLRDRHFKQLTRAAYKTLGGVGGALAQHAERTLDGMPPEERALTREAFRHLVTSQNTRAVLVRKELRQLLGSDGVIEKLIAARLLVASENEHGVEIIEVIHETLLASWPRLIEWRREDIEGTRFREQLRTAARQWNERDRAEGLLWRGDVLGELSRWRGRHSGPLTDVEAAFTDASLAEVARGRRNVRIAIAVAFAVLGAGIVALLITNSNVSAQRQRAEGAARDLEHNLRSRFEDQGRQLVLAGDPLRALAYLDKARSLGASGEIHDLLVAEALEQTEGKLFEVRHEIAARSPAFSPDGTRFATAGFDRVARIWDAKTGAKQLELKDTAAVVQAAFSPDGTTLATVNLDHQVVLWDARTGAAHRLDTSADRLVYDTRGDAITAGGEVAAWRSDGTNRWRLALPGPALALASTGDRIAVSAGDEVLVIDLDGAVVRRLRAPAPSENVLAMGSSRLAVGHGDAIRLFDLASGAQLASLAHLGAILWVALSPDGTRIATASADRSAAIWDATTGARLRTLSAHGGSVDRVVWSPDGRLVATSSKDATAALWDAESGELEARWRGHLDAVRGVAFDPNSARVLTASEDGRAIMWSAVRQSSSLLLRGHTGEVFNARFSKDGERIVSASDDGTVRTWHADTGALERTFEVPHAFDAAFSPDQHWIATGTTDGGCQIWDARSGAHVRDLWAPDHRDTIRFVQVAWSPDGASLAASSRGGKVAIWTTATWAPTLERSGNASVYTISTDASSVLAVDDDLVARRWSFDGKLISEDKLRDGPLTAQLAPDGSTRALMTIHQSPVVWDPQTHLDRIAMIGHKAIVVDAEWSPDARYAITASTDGSARIWDAVTGQALLAFDHPESLDGANLSRNRLVVAGTHGTLVVQGLPHYSGTAADLAAVLRCRVPFAIEVDREISRETSCE